MESKHPFGQWLKDQRRRAMPSLRQQDLADAIGVDRSYIVKIETGKIGLPNLETRQRIHAALGTTEDDLRELGIVRDAVGHSVGGSVTWTGGKAIATDRDESPAPVSLSLVQPSPLARALDAIWQSMTPEQRAFAMNALDAALAMPRESEGRDDHEEPRAAERRGRYQP